MRTVSVKPFRAVGFIDWLGLGMHQTKLTLRPSSSQRLAESSAYKPAQEPFCHHDNEKEGHEPSEQVPLHVGDDLGVGTHLIEATPLVRDLAIHNAPDRYTRH